MHGRKHRMPGGRAGWLTVGVVAVQLLAGCATQRPAGSATFTEAALRERYQQAIYASAIVDSSQVHALKPVPAGADSVLVVTWTTDATAERYYRVGQDTVGVDVWVTLVPEVQEACQGIPADRLTLRLQQLLGLPPRTESRTFVIMQAGVVDLFRPCLDPDPTTPRCPLAFPSDAPVDTTYRAWIAEQAVTRYQEPPAGYPWTRLGYTYDWYPDTPRYGASEYVLRRGSVVRVTAKQPTSAYCRPAVPAGSSSD